MDKNLLIELKDTYNKLQGDNTNEENIKIHVVIKFLEMLGYNPSWFHYEHREVKGKFFYDIAVFIENNQHELLIVEVKKKDKKLGIEEIVQLLNYMNIKQYAEWGLLTNGRKFLLVNNNIKAETKDRIVFEYDLLDDKNDEVLNHFTCENIFRKEVTNYFKFLKQYEVYYKQDNLASSFNVYYGTISNFFNYLSKKKRYYPLEKIRVEDFTDFVEFYDVNKKSNNRRKANEATLANKLAHINGLYETLKRKNEIKENPFQYITEQQRLKLQRKIKEPISDEEFKLMVNYYKNKEDGEKKTLVLLLLIYTGMDRSEIKTLKTSQINFEKKYIKIGQRNILLTEYLLEKIKKYIYIKEQQGSTEEYLFTSSWGNKSNEMFNESYFNRVVNDSLKQMGISEERQMEININFIKESFIRRMFQSGFHIEEIAYYTGLSISSLAPYFSIEDIEKSIDKKRILKRHPYSKLFQE